jgi:RNA polymerase sigma factor (TIGR02999 family)
MTTMTEELSPRVTRLLLSWSDGDREALDELVPLVLDDLRKIARRYLRRDQARRVFQTTALVDEFFVRILKRRSVSWKNHRHFFGVAADTMFRILVDQARRRNRLKREEPVALDRADLELIAAAGPDVDVVALHEALERLEARDPRAAEVVKLRFVVGLSVKETGDVLGIAPATVKRDWEFAQLWLYQQLSDGDEDEPPP